MHHGRHEKVPPHHLTAVLVALCLALTVVAFMASLNGGDAPRPAGDPALSIAGGGDGTPAGASFSPTEDAVADEDPAATEAERKAQAALELCQEVWAGQRAPLRTAARSLKQWHVHVDAMNQLVAGKITLDQANAFWERTRIGAMDRVLRFQQADAAYVAAAGGCVTPTAAASAAAAEELSTCSQVVEARNRALGSGRIAVTTWLHHVHDMERLRSGELSPQEATELWLASWRAGVEELDRYSADLGLAGRAGTC